MPNAKQKTKPFRIVQLTDLHLTPTDKKGRSEPNILGPLKGMNANFRALVARDEVTSADLILVTGDVTDRGDIASWTVFWDAIRANGLSKKVLVIPGNHDLCCLGIRARFRPSRIKEDLERAAAGLRMGNQPTKFPWAKQVDQRVAIFAVDSNNAGNYGVHDNAFGQIGFHQFLELGRLLRKYQSVPVKIVCLHHSPNLCQSETAIKRKQEPYSALDRLTMQMDQKDRQFLRVLCSSHGVRLIVHGHLHKADDQKVNGVRIVGAPASTEPTNKKTGELQFYEYIVRGAGGRVDRRVRRVRLA